MPASVQPMPLLVLETTTAAPKAPVTAAVVNSIARCEIIPPRRLLHQPSLLRRNLSDPLEIFVDEFLEFIACQEGVGLRSAPDVLFPLRRILHLAHHVHIKSDLIRRHLARQPDRA